jgi:hypothetical protein
MGPTDGLSTGTFDGCGQLMAVHALPASIAIPRFSASVVMALGFALLVIRAPHLLVRAQWTGEEGMAFYLPALIYPEPRALAETWAGTLHLAPRLAFEVVALFPPYWAPLVENVIALLMLAALAGFVASDRIPLPYSHRIAASIGLMLLSSMGPMIGTTLHANTFLALWVVLLVIAREPSSWQWAERGLVAVASLSGPFSTLLAPLMWWSLYRRRTRHAAWLAGIVTLGGIVSLVVLSLSGRPSANMDPVWIALTAPYRMALVPLLGQTISSWLRDIGTPAILEVAAGLAVVGALATVVVHRCLLPLVYVAIAVGLTSLRVALDAGGMWEPDVAARYFYFCTIAVAAIIGAGLLQRRRAAYLFAPLLVLGMVADFSIAPGPTVRWDHACIGSPEPCIIPAPDYPIRWPGDAEYVVPSAW